MVALVNLGYLVSISLFVLGLKLLLKEAVFQAMIAITLFIGMITFTGSVLAFAKLEEWTKEGPVVLPGHRLMNGLMLASIVVLSVIHVLNPSSPGILILIVIFAVSSVLGLRWCSRSAGPTCRS